jgi:hypothetical protein
MNLSEIINELKKWSESGEKSQIIKHYLYVRYHTLLLRHGFIVL